MARCGQIGREAHQGRHQQQVEEYRRSSRSSEAIQAVQYAGDQRRQADQRHVKEGDAREFHGEGEFARIGRKARRQHTNHLWHEDQRDQCQQRQPEHHQRAHAFRHIARRSATLGGQDAGKGGHKGGVEGALTK